MLSFLIVLFYVYTRKNNLIITNFLLNNNFLKLKPNFISHAAILNYLLNTNYSFH